MFKLMALMVLGLTLCQVQAASISVQNMTQSPMEVSISELKGKKSGKTSLKPYETRTLTLNTKASQVTLHGSYKAKNVFGVPDNFQLNVPATSTRASIFDTQKNPRFSLN